MKLLKDLGIWLLMFIMVFAVVYILVLTADAEYEVNQEREKIYFDRVEEMKNEI